jgi:hypothetical protein
MKLREMWRRLVGTDYTGTLEREVSRLRVENRALLNSILGIAGVPPIVVAADDTAAAATGKLGTETAGSNRDAAHKTVRCAANVVPVERASALGAKQASQGASAERGMKTVATPMRRRSWHQIYRMLEIDAARKKEAG